jgi:hypothetical protein
LAQLLIYSTDGKVMFDFEARPLDEIRPTAARVDVVQFAAAAAAVVDAWCWCQCPSWQHR